MRIGLDLDGIFVSAPPFIPKAVIERLYRKHGKKTLDYRIPGILEQKIRKLSHNRFLRPRIAKNIAILETLTRNHNHKFYLISSRFSFLETETKKLITSYHLAKFFEKMYFNIHNHQPHIYKNQILKKVKIDRFIDDDLELLKFLAEKNKRIRFYWLNNKKSNKINNNLFAITSINEIINN